MFSSKVTLLIALGLVVPEVLRALNGSLEPYPAVLLPAGAGKISLRDGGLPITRIVLQAKRNGEWRQVDPAAFLDPMPVHFVGAIARAQFGLRSDVGAPNKPKKRLEVPPPTPNVAQIEQTQRWLRNKLRSLGYAPDALRVTKEELFLEIPSGRIHSSRTLEVQTYALD
jgi:hypothetical protein